MVVTCVKVAFSFLLVLLQRKCVLKKKKKKKNIHEAFLCSVNGTGGVVSGGSVPVAGPVCASGQSPCSSGTALPSTAGTVCLSGAASPFGAVLDVTIRCINNGTQTVWATCAGTQYPNCGACSCRCYDDADLTAYVNSISANLTTTGTCLPATFLPNAINPISISVGCATCV